MVWILGAIIGLLLLALNKIDDIKKKQEESSPR
jgi:hypothetical protein